MTNPQPTAPTLLPCPFCQDEPDIEERESPDANGDRTYRVVCMNVDCQCRVSTDWLPEWEARKVWKRRAAPPVPASGEVDFGVCGICRCAIIEGKESPAWLLCSACFAAGWRDKEAHPPALPGVAVLRQARALIDEISRASHCEHSGQVPLDSIEPAIQRLESALAAAPKREAWPPLPDAKVESLLARAGACIDILARRLREEGDERRAELCEKVVADLSEFYREHRLGDRAAAAKAAKEAGT